MKTENKINIIISGGGTGGHIFPAVAIADELKERLGNGVEILFLGAEGRMEMEKVPEAGYRIEGLSVSGFQRSLSLKNLSFPFKLAGSLVKAGKIIKRFKPLAAIGTGGYASGPLLYRAALKGIPTLILEQNSYPGITNKILAGKVAVICTAYPGMEKYFPEEKIIVTGTPVRKEILNLKPDKGEALEFFGLQNDKKTLLVIGGSQGAKRINEAIAANINKIVTRDVQLVWQTGKPSFESAKKTAAEAKFAKNIVVKDFIYKMDMAYAAADLVVSRSGAIAVAEIVSARKPAVFIPLPSAAEDHQTHNAKMICDKNAAIMLNENEAGEKAGELIAGLLHNNQKLDELKKNIGKFEKKDAAKEIVNIILKMIKR